MKMMKYVVKIQIFISPPSFVHPPGQQGRLWAYRTEIYWIILNTSLLHVSNTEIKFYPEFNGFQKFVQFYKNQFGFTKIS